MPFYLVTHTALAEADDEVGAAEKVLAKLQADARVAFTVKFDETSIKNVSISRYEESYENADTQRTDEYQENMLRREMGGIDKYLSELNRKTSFHRISCGAVLIALYFAICCIVAIHVIYLI